MRYLVPWKVKSGVSFFFYCTCYLLPIFGMNFFFIKSHMIACFCLDPYTLTSFLCSYCVLYIHSVQLWALLHFIMPTLFDDHEEFNEWFSKDIESHAENRSSIDKSKCDTLDVHLFKILQGNVWCENVKSLDLTLK